ncbi:DUF7124 domain-containing protein [Haloprofundus marisrubri]|uniref:DUF7124 domain-containing protein n=1 Tax=Haloprofundus marisrubri TaxID=1514971 RepID=UPI001F0AE974|nr:hypothetical protein [Haloprofundus marisrubri]
MTLAFELASLQQIREPQAVVVDARRWAQNVGLVSTDSDAAHAFSAEHLIRRDFQVRPTSSNFQRLCSQFNTERHVLVGAVSNHPGYLPQPRWEYLSLGDAADAAGWELETPDTPPRTRWTARLNRILRTQE